MLTIEWKPASFEEGWDIINMGIKRFINILEGLPEPEFTSEECSIYMTVYIYYSQQLYDKYKETFEDYIKSTVYDEMSIQAMDVILAMMDRKRAGETIDETLVNNALTFYSEIGESTRKIDPKQFAETMIK